MSDAVLVTGAFGLVGSATVRHLAAAGRRVVATDLDTPANRRAAGALPAGVRTHWADLTDPAAVEALLATARPSSIIHLAAMIPPLCYATPDLARKVNVEATATLVKVAAAQPDCPRIVFASSIAVYGPRNPHRCAGLLTADTPVRPYDIYGLHKVEAEAIVRESGLAWVILRLGGVLAAEPKLNADPDLIYLAGALPTDGRLQTVDVRDVAHAFAAATTAEVAGRTLLVGGDASHRQLQGDVAAATAAAIGLVGAVPAGRIGDPADDDAWFVTDWMDCDEAQRLLAYQHHPWPQMLAETAQRAGLLRYPLRLLAPVARQILTRRSPYHHRPGRYADPWEAIRRRWGAAAVDGRPA